MSAAQARTQRCLQVRRKGIADQFGDSQFSVSLKNGTATYDVANLSIVWGYPELLAFKNKIDVAIALLEPPTPTGRTYHPIPSEH